jgi:hypothetical protein
MLWELKQMVTSSTYRVVTDGPTALTITLMATANKVSVKTDPCGTPFSCE